MSLNNSTYIVGAGFSKYAGLPLMNDFFFKSKDLYAKLSEKDRKTFDKIFEFYKDYSEVKNFMNMDLMNIEELLSIIEMNKFLNNNNYIKQYYTNFLKIVIENYTKINDKASDTQSNQIKKKYVEFIDHVYGFESEDTPFGKVRKPKFLQNGIISLNYDLVLESSIFNNYEYEFGYGIDDKYIDHRFLRFKNKLNLAKIHGSINFIDGASYLIVPPTWNKTSEAKIRPIWKLANDLLTNSENLFFIGYSLPKTDLYVKYLLINGIQKCKNLKRIIVICPDKDNLIQSRFEDFFESYFREKSFKFIPKKFEEINWSRLRYSERKDGKLINYDIISG